MTCIVGVVDREGRVWMGGDARASMGWVKQQLSGPKVFRNGPMLLGGTGALRSLQLLQYALTVPEHPEGLSIEGYLSTTFVNAVRECFKAAGLASKTNEQESHNGAILVGYRGTLAQIDSGYGVLLSAHGYDAVGSGAEVALGALYATEELPARHRVRLALEAATRFSTGVGGPFTIECLEPLQVVTVAASAVGANGSAKREGG